MFEVLIIANCYKGLNIWLRNDGTNIHLISELSVKDRYILTKSTKAML